MSVLVIALSPLLLAALAVWLVQELEAWIRSVLNLPQEEQR